MTSGVAETAGHAHSVKSFGAQKQSS